MQNIPRCVDLLEEVMSWIKGATIRGESKTYDPLSFIGIKKDEVSVFYTGLPENYTYIINARKLDRCHALVSVVKERHTGRGGLYSEVVVSITSEVGRVAELIAAIIRKMEVKVKPDSVNLYSDSEYGEELFRLAMSEDSIRLLDFVIVRIGDRERVIYRSSLLPEIVKFVGLGSLVAVLEKEGALAVYRDSVVSVNYNKRAYRVTLGPEAEEPVEAGYKRMTRYVIPLPGDPRGNAFLFVPTK